MRGIDACCVALKAPSAAQSKYSATVFNEFGCENKWRIISACAAFLGDARSNIKAV